MKRWAEGEQPVASNKIMHSDGSLETNLERYIELRKALEDSHRFHVRDNSLIHYRYPGGTLSRLSIGYINESLGWLINIHEPNMYEEHRELKDMYLSHYSVYEERGVSPTSTV